MARMKGEQGMSDERTLLRITTDTESNFQVDYGKVLENVPKTQVIDALEVVARYQLDEAERLRSASSS